MCSSSKSAIQARADVLGGSRPCGQPTDFEGGLKHEGCQQGRAGKRAETARLAGTPGTENVTDPG
jgi:hypothetical protein